MSAWTWGLQHHRGSTLYITLFAYFLLISNVSASTRFAAKRLGLRRTMSLSSATRYMVAVMAVVESKK